ncbi:hypothetical protein [Qipengyuania flava]|uniref:hypothetical protein n=1 Tax=Qipengyuania flava TaxID=192812 RepID=UPI001C62E306|nr:hypothetical protein [Qipengyuania flava]QYJ06977.1 hypothetical protein KUV82_13185 [Qipengyuania flava]
MTDPAPPSPSLRQRYDELSPELRERLPAIVLALGIEALLLLILLSLGSVQREIVEMRDTLVAFTAPSQDEAQEDTPPSEPAAAPQPATVQPVTPPQPPVDTETPPPVTPSPPARPILRNSFSLENVPQPPRPAPRAQAPQQTYGPAFTPSPGDTPRIAGSGPNGEPLYAARWYRRPYQDELAGYLSTAQGPGWGMIDCRTAPDFRVEDCVIVGEAPQGSGLGRAVQAAAWQFKVRPPQRGGMPLVGEWVRIRIDYRIDRIEQAQQRFGQ